MIPDARPDDSDRLVRNIYWERSNGITGYIVVVGARTREQGKRLGAGRAPARRRQDRPRVPAPAARAPPAGAQPGHPPSARPNPRSDGRGRRSERLPEDERQAGDRP